MNKEKQFNILYTELVRVNEFINLTAIVDKNEVKVKHFLDSLSAVEVIKERVNIINKQETQTIKVLDVGAGAGFHSLPLAIELQDNNNINFILVETVGKKVNFIKETIEKIGLKNAEVVKSRVEDLNKDIKYDICVSRAVANMNTLLEYCMPFIKIGGILIMYKGNNADLEIEGAKKALKELGGSIKNVHKYNLEYNGEILERNLVIVEKAMETPVKYPRGGNKERKEPIL